MLQWWGLEGWGLGLADFWFPLLRLPLFFFFLSLSLSLPSYVAHACLWMLDSSLGSYSYSFSLGAVRK